MKVCLKIQRYNPYLAEGQQYYCSEYHLEVAGNMRLVVALEQIARQQDTTLTFRRSCVHGVCGSDAMRVNGVEMLACKALFEDIATEENHYTLEIAPLRHLPLEKDLIVRQEPLFERYRAVQPYLIPAEIPQGTPKKNLKGAGTADAGGPTAQESLQSPEQRELVDAASSCLACGACFSACPTLQKNPDFLGPMALVQASRFVNDSRDQGLRPRLAVLDSPNGVWGCENLFECTKVCPRGIKITKLINQMKQMIQKV